MYKFRASIVFILICFLVGCDKFEWLDVQPTEESKAILLDMQPLSISCTGSILNKTELSIFINSSVPFSKDFKFLSRQTSLETKDGRVVLLFDNCTDSCRVTKVSENGYNIKIKRMSSLRKCFYHSSEQIRVRLWFENDSKIFFLTYNAKRK